MVSGERLPYAVYGRDYKGVGKGVGKATQHSSKAAETAGYPENAAENPAKYGRKIPKMVDIENET